mgnify:CR=1 FL=1
MKITETVTETKEEIVVIKVVCNKCGKEINVIDNMFSEDEMYDFSVQFGFYSKKDGEVWNFDLCEDCLVELANTFKHKPDIRSIFIEGDGSYY